MCVLSFSLYAVYLSKFKICAIKYETHEKCGSEKIMVFYFSFGNEDSIINKAQQNTRIREITYRIKGQNRNKEKKLKLEKEK